MEIGEVFYPENREMWRNWLFQNHTTEKEIWLRTPHVKSGLARLPYDDAVEEALCFGWIDGLNKKYDEVSSAQRYTPRRKKSFLSELNRQRMFKLIRHGLMTQAGLEAVGDQLGNEDDPLIIPEDVVAALKEDPAIWKIFNEFPLKYRKLKIGFVMECRQRSLVESNKRLAYLIKMTGKGKMYGTVVDF
jgi:uncharacterized protein YdeI (YjbR/CyaY-like superfamily)